ncbi:MAG: hypothetical protein PW843_15155 [Azospirillaceae bacterium]|nr:hypothetical protein [Azospirillaceae bacterium]
MALAHRVNGTFQKGCNAMGSLTRPQGIEMVANQCLLTAGVGVAINSVSYLDGSVSIGDSSSPGTEPFFLGASPKITLELDCDRTGSAVSAQNFIRMSGGNANNMFTNIHSGDTPPPDFPALLNFCFGYMVSFMVNNRQSFLCELYFGQGHFDTNFSSVNNWWIGSPSIVGSGSAANLGNVIQITGNGTDGFTFSV